MGGFCRHAKRLCSLSLSALLLFNAPVHAKEKRPTMWIAEIVDGLKQELGIPQPIEVKIVSRNRRAFSVEAAKDRSSFVLLVSGRFLRELDEQEIAAAVAHELGHVWIYTHFPFLHTEALANEIAMCVMSRESLKKLYAKVRVFESHSDDTD
jgi:Peptidase family M48